MLKLFSEIFKPDSRYDIFVKVNRLSGETSPLTIEHHYTSIANMQLNTAVPEAVRSLFDKARNVFIYGWFDYDLIAISDGLAWVALEFALRKKVEGENASTPKERGLYNLLQIAVERGWLRDSGFTRAPPIKADPQAFCRQLPQLVSSLRNEFAHGSETVSPPGEALVVFDLCAEIINQLFQGDSKP